MTSSGLISEVPAADRLDARAGATASAETCELLNAMTGSASACLLAPPDWSVLCSAPPAASVPRSLYEKLCPPPWEEPCLFDLRELEPALLTGSDVPAGLAALAVVPLGDENGLWGAAVLCWAAAPSHLITPQWLAALGPMVSAARARAPGGGPSTRRSALGGALRNHGGAHAELESDELLEVLLQRSIQLVQAEGGAILLLDRERDEVVISVAWSVNHEFERAIGRRVPRGEGAAWRAIETGRTFVVSDYSHWNGRASVLAGISIPAVLSVPLWGGAGPFGALNVTRTGAPLTFSEDDIHLVELFARAAAALLEAAQVRKQAAASALAEERTRLARDLHDGLAQDLAALLLRADACQALLGEGNEALHGQLETISVGLQRTIRDARATIFALRPAEQEDCSLEDGLRAAAVRFEGQTRVPVDFFTIGADCQQLSHEYELVLLRLAQEALVNIRKHAQARRVQVQLTWLGTEQVQLCVSDDGRGFDPSIVAGAGSIAGQHLGLTLMRERVEKLGGSLSVQSGAGEGATVCVVLPITRGGAPWTRSVF